MRLWSIFAPLYTFSFCTVSFSGLFGDNQATQFMSLTVAVDLSANVTLSAYQETQYRTATTNQTNTNDPVMVDSAAYILVPTVSVTQSASQILSAGSLILDFQIQVRPNLTSPGNFQLQGSVLSPRYNLLGFLGADYYSPQFFLLQLQGKASRFYAYPTISIGGNPLKLWNLGQTTIGTGTAVPSQTTSFLVTPSYQTPNLLASSAATVATQTLNLTMSIPSTVVKLPSGVYFFQIYLTVNPYQTLSNTDMINFLTPTQQMLNVLLKQAGQFNPKLYTSVEAAQLILNQAFLTKELAELTAVINSL